MYSSVSVIWVLVAAALVFFMQAGFAMVETGFTRAKNAGNIIMKNLMDFAIGTPIYWLFGFGLMFAGSSALVGGIDLFSTGDYASILPAGIPKYVFFIFQTVFCATAATIVSGAMAERTKFISYCIYSAIISAVIYPISGHWIWGGGWLSQLGFHDFAGSTAVHMVGGVAALVGAKILGPRIGKYSKDGTAKAIPGHSITLGALGVFILWFCWFGFNGGSTVCAEGDDVLVAMGSIFTTTNLAAAVATVTTMIITWVRYKKPDVSMTLNGSLAGLVAITAGCDVVDPIGAFFIGICAGFVVVFGIEFIDKVLKIDDPVGAIGVHGLCGATGTILTGLFSTSQGLFYGYGASFLGIQVLGVVAVFLWVAITMTLVFMILKNTVGLRVTREEEISGLDLPEHGLVSAYADFYTMSNRVVGEVAATIESSKVSIEKAVPVERLKPREVGSDVKMTQIRIITKESQFEALKAAMNTIGITGMTVNHVLGCGMQKGATEYYRGVPLEINLLPKIQVDIVVCKIPVSTVVEEAKRILYTGHIGDGKIFVYDVENVIKVRTGEEGYDALQDVE
ncbi:adenylate cyclase [Sporanaerobium hydrogeniformans]|uniref:Adenylate cyclase n=2 Tax=Sporanaerobium hydrogeniformans TaxID=3072179 RepID=A0AC61DDD6_9FIRM|nr:ammonium transporter [Sporanaerobium hydrogeniformans]PHV70955.1 adenylate cyclase [Sporanaerobium hydrogeniformans]